MSHRDPMDHRAPSPEEIERQAWTWLRLLTSGEPKAWDIEGFRRWVRVDPARRAVFNEVRRRWEEIKQPAGLLQREEATAARPALERGTRRRGPMAGRRALLGGAVGAVAAAGVAVACPPLGLWPAPDEWRADDRTGAGEQRTLALADRISVTLNTRTSVRRQMDDGGETVGLDLLAGEAAIDLKGAGRAFGVTAGAGRSLADSGQFEVRYLDGKVCVTCVDGTLRLEHPAGSQVLRARQQAVYDGHAVSGIANVEPAQVSAWRSGELLFSQARLADVVEEINRYRSGRVVLMNDRVRNKTVNGRFAIASLDLALEQLQLSFGLKARSLPGGLLFLS
jgi:transmembrane sensor